VNGPVSQRDLDEWAGRLEAQAARQFGRTRPSPARRRRKRWHQRWWAFRLPALLLAALIGITALGATVGPAPVPVKTTTIKTTTAAAYYPATLESP
jgi:hypothetical protein